MGEPRKVFRIEEMAALRRSAAAVERTAAARDTELLAEISALRAILTAAPQRQANSIEALQNAETALHRIAGPPDAGADGRAASMMRIARELDAVVSGSEQATQRVLAAAEEIDQAANNLSAALKGRIEQGMAQDIRDLVIKIFEACNFQDLAGQRIAKVMATLRAIEDHIARVLDEFKSAAARRDGAQYLHGPPLDTDCDHASQNDIDTLFQSRG